MIFDQLPKSLNDIISFDNKHTILVYDDGTCESLENRTENRQSKGPAIVDTKMQQIVNIACFYTLDNRVMLTYFLRHKKTGAMEFVHFLLNDDDLTPSESAEAVCKVPIERNATLSAFTVVRGETFPSVLTICKDPAFSIYFRFVSLHSNMVSFVAGSDKRIFMLPLRYSESTPMKAEFEFVEMFSCLRVDKPLTVISVSTNCIAIYGGNTKQHGASLILYNTRHHIVQMAQNFKVHLDTCRLWVIDNYILMAVGQRLSCARFLISQEKLSDIIGSKRSTESNKLVVKDRINEESELEDNSSFNKDVLGSIENFVQKTPTPKSLKKKVHPRSEYRQPTEIFENFEANLATLYNFDMDVAIVQDNAPTDSIKVRSSVHPKDRPFSYIEIQSLVAELENCGVSETEISEHVIPLLINAKLSSELAVCLRKYTNVSERMLAQSLKYFIGMGECDDKLTYIKQIFTCSFGDELIREALRTNLNLDNAIYLLDLIHQQLGDEYALLDESPQYGHNFDGDVALVKWFMVILDAHYQQFLLARDSSIIEKIVEWKALIESFVEAIRDMKSISGQLRSFVRGKWKGDDNKNSKWYTVEGVQLYS